MDTPFQNCRILLGVTGSIAAYKAADLASKLAQAGAQVDVILTQAALQFVTPLTFQSVTGRQSRWRCVKRARSSIRCTAGQSAGTAGRRVGR